MGAKRRKFSVPSEWLQVPGRQVPALAGLPPDDACAQNRAELKSLPSPRSVLERPGDFLVFCGEPNMVRWPAKIHFAAYGGERYVTWWPAICQSSELLSMLDDLKLADLGELTPDQRLFFEDPANYFFHSAHVDWLIEQIEGEYKSAEDELARLSMRYTGMIKAMAGHFGSVGRLATHFDDSRYYFKNAMASTLNKRREAIEHMIGNLNSIKEP